MQLPMREVPLTAPSHNPNPNPTVLKDLFKDPVRSTVGQTLAILADPQAVDIKIISNHRLRVQIRNFGSGFRQSIQTDPGL